MSLSILPLAQTLSAHVASIQAGLIGACALLLLSGMLLWVLLLELGAAGRRAWSALLALYADGAATIRLHRDVRQARRAYQRLREIHPPIPFGFSGDGKLLARTPKALLPAAIAWRRAEHALEDHLRCQRLSVS
jgi:hypothetical protein